MTLADQCVKRVCSRELRKAAIEPKPASRQVCYLSATRRILPCAQAGLAAFDQTKSVLVPIRHRSEFDSARDETV